MEHEGKMKKKKNVQDATLKNNRARKKEIQRIEKKFDKAVTFILTAKENRIKKLEARTARLEQWCEALTNDLVTLDKRIT